MDKNSWRVGHVVPEMRQWIKGLTETIFPMVCQNCSAFPTVPVFYRDGGIRTRFCSFCYWEVKE